MTVRDSLRVLALLTLSVLGSSCAAMLQQWQQSNCNYDAAYAAGMNAQKVNAAADPTPYGQCPSDSRPLAMRGYNEGYQASAQVQVQAQAQADAQWQAANCSYDAAYAFGMNAQRSGAALDPSRFAACPGESQEAAMRGYHVGYEAALRDTRPRGVVVAPPPVNRRRFLCSVVAFGSRYDAFGPTQVEATLATQTDCSKSNNAMFCKEVTCQENR